MDLLGCLFGFIIGIFFLCVFVLQYLQYKVRKFFGFGPNSKSQHGFGQQSSQSSNTDQSSQSSSTNSANHQKIFADDEGEYVEFEEIKD